MYYLSYIFTTSAYELYYNIGTITNYINHGLIYF